MKTWMVPAGILLCVVAGYFLFFSEQKIANYPPRNGPIVAFGDSLVQGVGAKEGEDFVSRLSEKIGEPIINMGVSGNTTRDGLARIDSVIAEDPRIVLVLLGGNDYLKQIPREETFANLRIMIEKLQADGAVTVVLGVRGGVLVDHFDVAYESLAQETHSLYVPDVLDGLFGDTSLMADGIHPNSAGYARITEKVYPILEQVLQ